MKDEHTFPQARIHVNAAQEASLLFSRGLYLWLILWALSVSILAPLSGAASTRQEQDSPAPKIIRKSGGVLQGSAIRKVEPAYPPLAKAAKVSGTVVVEITIDEEGKVIAAHPLSGHPLLKDAAVAAAQGWVFKPTLLQGTPVKVIGTITFNFTMDSEDEIKQASEEVKQHPESADAHCKLAMALGGAGRDSDARSEFEEAIKLNPDSFDARSSFASLLVRLNENDAAIDELKDAAKIATLTPKMRVSLARQFLALNQNELAFSQLDQALKENPESEEILQRVIYVYIA
ncbi:MAG TPA: TonB family protein, partial [Blastocatellia bacterium]|nr:TonB family protein [Blastocatellia bacterium]